MNAETPRRGEEKAACHAEVLRSISRGLREGREILRSTCSENVCPSRTSRRSHGAPPRVVRVSRPEAAGMGVSNLLYALYGGNVGFATAAGPDSAAGSYFRTKVERPRSGTRWPHDTALFILRGVAQPHERLSMTGCGPRSLNLLRVSESRRSFPVFPGVLASWRSSLTVNQY